MLFLVLTDGDIDFGGFPLKLQQVQMKYDQLAQKSIRVRSNYGRRPAAQLSLGDGFGRGEGPVACYSCIVLQ